MKKNSTIPTPDESFGEYFDAQYDRLRKMLDNKDAQQQKEWLEEWTRRQKDEKEDRETQV